MPQPELPKQMLKRVLHVAELLANAEVQPVGQTSAATTSGKADNRSLPIEPKSADRLFTDRRLDEAQDSKKHSL